MERFGKITAGSGVVLRPWLQAFRWRTPTYSPKYIQAQVKVAKEKGGIGFLFWNAANDYSKPFAAMPVMRADAPRYFRDPQIGGKPSDTATPAAGASGNANDTKPATSGAAKPTESGQALAAVPPAH